MKNPLKLTFKGKTNDGENPILTGRKWSEITAACKKLKSWAIEVIDRGELDISEQQMKYWHAVPVNIYAEYTGTTLWKAEQLLKRECGENYFVHKLKNSETRRGQVMFECKDPLCRNLFRIPVRMKNDYGTFLCPICLKNQLEIIFMLSKTELKVSEFNDVLENTWDYLESIGCKCPPPDPEWRKNEHVSFRKGGLRGMDASQPPFNEII